MSKKNRAHGKAGAAVKRERSPLSDGQVFAEPCALDRIQARAYELYRTRSQSGGGGDAVSDWLQAERELNGAGVEPSACREIEIKPFPRGENVLGCGK